MLSFAVLILGLLALLKLGLFLLLCAAALHLLRLALWSWQKPAPAVAPSPWADSPDSDLPWVTVQLPMYNERAVAERAIAAACALDWPRLSIDVLDDSTDDTRDLIDRAVTARQQQGIAIRVLRRPDRRGFKAGNLAHGLSKLPDDCSFVAIFDADFVPPPDFLRRLMPVLRADAKAAFVQSRWAYLNEGQNLLTRLQALILDGLMLVEQAYLDAHGLPLQWNGTSGIFRVAALHAAGGWLGDARQASVLTEDLDVSYRALLQGYRGRQVAAVAAHSELPAGMHAFRVQQQRWVGGGAQVLRSLFGRIAREGLGLRTVLSLLSHLARHARQPYLALSLLWLPLLCFGVPGLALDSTALDSTAPPSLVIGLQVVLNVASLRLGLSLFALAVVLYYGAARRQAGRSVGSAFLLAPLLVPLSMGLALPLSAALLRGLLQAPEQSVFQRTPKAGDPTSSPPAAGVTPSPPVPANRARLAWGPILEAALGIVYLGLAAVAVLRAQLQTALALALCVALGLLWVGIGSLRRAGL